MKKIKTSHKIGLFFAIILLLGIISIELILPLGENLKKNEWNEIVSERMATIKDITISKFLKTEEQFVRTKNLLKSDLKEAKISDEKIQADLIDILNTNGFEKFSITITDSSLEPLAWNDKLFTKEFYSYGIKKYGFNNSHFFTTELKTYLSIIDTLSFNEEMYYVFISDVVEKHYQLKNRYFTEESLKAELTDEIRLEFEILFSDEVITNNDNSKFLFEVENIKGNRIASVIVDKPIRLIYFYSSNQLLKNTQKIIGLILFLIISIFIYNKIKSISAFYFVEIYYILTLFVLRIILFVFEIPKQFVEGSLTDSSYFSSKFGYGIVSSPLELFITVLFTFAIIYIISRRLLNSSKLFELKNSNLTKSIIVTLISVVVFIIALRGFGASVKSIVFDSTLYYFKDISLLLGVPKTVILFSLLGIGILSLWLSGNLLRYNLSYFPAKFKSLVILFCVYQIGGFIYDYTQTHPQGSDFTRILYITLVFVLIYLRSVRHLETRSVLVYLSFLASITSITHLIYFDHQLEKESLKTKAIELVRPDEDLLEHQLRSVMSQFDENEKLNAALAEGSSNYDATAFALWSKSLLHTESVNSSISILDTAKIVVGEFSFKFDKEIDFEELIVGLEEEIVVQEKDNVEDNSSLLHGIIPLFYENEPQGYLVISIYHDLTKVIAQNEIDLLIADKIGLTASSLKNNLNVIEFFDSKVIFSQGELDLSNEIITQITEYDFKDDNEGWLYLSSNNKTYQFFLLKSFIPEYNSILAVGIEEGSLTINLYDFFKVFFIHTFIISLIVIIYWIFRLLKYREIKITYQGQLLSAFLVISIIPLILLAFYFRTLTEEKNSNAINYKLKKRAVNVEKYCKENLTLEENIFNVFNNAHLDLGIDFSIFKGENLIFSSEANYYQIGLLNDHLNSLVYKRLYLLGYSDQLVVEKIEDYQFNSFYYISRFNSEKYIIKINDTFNRILLPMSDTEVDVFLFGSYSFALLLVIIISTLFANQISNPIKRLTAATKDIAEGKMDITLENKSKGEIGELISGFNMMVKDLEKSRKELAEVEREYAWKEMARQVAHEIKNPLTPMKLSVQQLIIAFNDKSPKFDDIFAKVSTTIINQIDTLKNIANEFSNYARMPKLNIVRIDIIKSINDSFNLYIDKRVELKLNTKYKEAIVEADKDQIQRAFINLIRNAIQAGAKEIEFSLEKDNSYYSIYIKDNGKGISDDIKHRIFEPDFTTKVEGMGLGLDMVKKYFLKTNGSIEVDHTSNFGTTFLIKIPLINDETN